MTSPGRTSGSRAVVCWLALVVTCALDPPASSAQELDVASGERTCDAPLERDPSVARGVVRDGATGRPLPRALVEVAGSRAAGRTDGDSVLRIRADSAGRFRLCGLGDSDSLYARARTRSFAGDVTAVASRDLGSTTVLPVDLGAPGRIVGTVVDRSSDEVLAGATVEVPGLGVTEVTDARGRFVLERLPSLRLDLRVTHLGHGVVRDSVHVRPSRSVHLRVDLPADPLDVEALELTVEAVRPRWLEKTGFYRRREKNPGGRFFTRDDLRERDLLELSDLFPRLPGMRLNEEGEPVVGRRPPSYATHGTCGVQYVLNGQPVLRGLDIDAFAPKEIAALELYRGGSEIPARFNVRRSSACGVLVVWTRKQ